MFRVATCLLLGVAAALAGVLTMAGSVWTSWAGERLAPDGSLTSQGARLALLLGWALVAGLALVGAAGERWRRRGQLEAALESFRDVGLWGSVGGWRELATSGGLALAVVALGLLGGRKAWLVREDGPVEVAQVLVLLGAAGIVLGRAGRLAGASFERLAFGLFGFGLLAVAGEEISWGQRLLGWETPTAWKQLNYQGETNLHNVIPPLAVESYNLATVAFVLVSLALALWQADGGAGARRWRWLAPAPSWLPLALAVGLCWALRLAGVVRSAEIEELAAYLWFLGWALALRQRPASAA
jgi:hypothetical protein